MLQAKAQLNQAQRDLAREKALLEQNASTTDMVKNLEDRVSMTAAMVHEAEAMLGFTTITAPFDGVIARKPADVGDLATPGMPLLDIEGANEFEIEAGIPDSLASHLQPGAELDVSVPNGNVSFTGKLTELSSAADVHAHTVSARIAVPAGAKVRSGQFARVHVPGAPTRALVVPATAISTLGQMDRVFVAVDQRAVLRLVKPGARRGDQVEILAGLSAGEVVVDRSRGEPPRRPAAGGRAVSAASGSPFPDPKAYGFAGRLASMFIDSKLTPIVVAASLLLGAFAILMLPREEEPQIKVPMIDVMVAMPGAECARRREPRHAPDRKAALGNRRRRIPLLDRQPGRESYHRPLQGRHRSRGGPRAAEPETADEFRPHPARRDAAVDQAAHNRRRADRRAHVPQRPV